jgi:hypothetical protein
MDTLKELEDDLAELEAERDSMFQDLRLHGEASIVHPIQELDRQIVMVEVDIWRMKKIANILNVIDL